LRDSVQMIGSKVHVAYLSAAISLDPKSDSADPLSTRRHRLAHPFHHLDPTRPQKAEEEAPLDRCHQKMRISPSGQWGLPVQKKPPLKQLEIVLMTPTFLKT
jgi:hypothetical protein